MNKIILIVFSLILLGVSIFAEGKLNQQNTNDLENSSSSDTVEVSIDDLPNRDKAAMKEINISPSSKDTETPILSNLSNKDLLESNKSATPPKPDLKKDIKLFESVKAQKRRTAIIGNTLFFTGTLIKYGLILPQANKLEIDDVSGQLALLSPMFLSIGLQGAGATMSCMRTSESVKAYKKYVSDEAPRNLSWISFIAGYGFMAGAQAASAFGQVSQREDFYTAARGLDIIADLFWAFANIYSLVYITKLGEQLRDSNISLAPGVSSTGASALMVTLRF